MSALQTLPHVTERTNSKPRRRILLALLALGVAVPLAACAGGPQETVSGTITTRERVVMPPDAVLVVRLLDATRGDMAAYTMVEQRLVANPLPSRFELRYRYGDISPSGTYYVQAQIEQGGRVLYINDQNYSVLTRNSPYRNVLVNLIPAAGTMMVPSSSMAPATSTTTTTVIQTTPAAPVPPTTIILPGGSVVTPR